MTDSTAPASPPDEPPAIPPRPVAGGRDLVVPGDGVRLAATRWHGVGTPVLFLHGLASQRHFWGPVANRLAGLPMIALDERGHGESEQPDTGYDVATFVRDVTVALDALGLSRVLVVGHSWGASVALALAAAQPERVLGVVAIEGGITTPRTRWTREQAREALAPPVLGLRPEELRERLREGQLGPWWRPEVEQALLPLFTVGDDGLVRNRLRRDNHLALVDAMWDYDPEATLAAVRAACWIVSARAPRDASATAAGPDTGGDLARMWEEQKAAGLALAERVLFRPRLVSVVGGVHDVPLQWPALVAGIVRAAAEETGHGGPTGGIG